VVSVTDPYGRILGFLDRTCCVNPIDNIHYAPKTYKLNYKYDNYTRNLVGRSFGRCLRNRLLSGSSMRFTIRPFGCVLRRALY
jgi:hypothetical protein